MNLPVVASHAPSDNLVTQTREGPLTVVVTPEAKVGIITPNVLRTNA